MKKELDINYSYQNCGDFVYKNTVFVNCVFVQSCFDTAQFINCAFIACNFSLASFEDSIWDRCNFKSCDFPHAFMDSSTFKECNLSLCNFHSVNFQSCKFGINHSEGSIFTHAIITENTHIPATSREFVGEIIRALSDKPRMQAFGALVTQCTEFCWETLIAMAKHFLQQEELIEVYNGLNKYPNFAKLLNKYFNNKGLLYGGSS